MMGRKPLRHADSEPNTEPKQEWTAYYVSQLYRNKKVKSYQDGFIIYDPSARRVILLDEKRNRLDSMFAGDTIIQPDSELEFDKYYCLVDQLTTGKQQSAKPLLPIPSAMPIANRTTTRDVPSNSTSLGKRSQRQCGLTKNSSKRLHQMPMPSTMTNDPQNDHDINVNPSVDIFTNLHGLGEDAVDDHKMELDSTADAFLQAMSKPDEPLSRTISATSPSMPRKQQSMPLHRLPQHNRTRHSVTNATKPFKWAEYVEDHNESPQTQVEEPTSSQPSPSGHVQFLKNAKTNIIDEERRISNINQNSQTLFDPTPQPEKFKPHALNIFRFLPASSCANLTSSTISRVLSIPSTFPSYQLYKAVFLRAIFEHLQVQLTQIAHAFHTLVPPRTGKFSEMERYYRGKGVHLYADVKLSRIAVQDKKALLFNQSLSDRFHNNIVLLIGNKEHHSCYSKDDVWVVSKEPKFQDSFLARSVYYGISNNSLEITPCSERDKDLYLKQYPNLSNDPVPVFAIRCVNATTEAAMEANLKEATESPLLECITDPLSAKCLMVNDLPVDQASALLNLAQETCDAFGLNEKQTQVLCSFVQSLAGRRVPITLAHGVFGSGKSHLVCVVILCLYRAVAEGILPEDFRVMVSSMTNVAVDRILQGLLKRGFTNFVRVGSLKKIEKTILPYTAQQLRSENEDMKELNSMLRDNDLSPTERKAVQEALCKFKANENQELVKNSFIVGVTCMATTFEILSNFRADAIILDECSQMTEPLSLLPIAKFQSTHALLIGDPLQLPPTLTTPCNNPSTGLERTLFERISEAGLEPIVLFTQYRCHPQIAKVANGLFYSGQLRTGESIDVAPVIFGIPPLVFVDVNGMEEGSGYGGYGGSLSNLAEVSAIASVLKLILYRGVPPKEIGVITFYKSQADSLSGRLKSEPDFNGVQISTVDAFQGSEKAIILISTVRTRSTRFIDDPRRLNVALTRAKRHLFIVGNGPNLCKNGLYNKLINDHSNDIKFETFIGLLKSNELNEDVIDTLHESLQPIPDPARSGKSKTLENLAPTQSQDCASDFHGNDFEDYWSTHGDDEGLFAQVPSVALADIDEPPPLIVEPNLKDMMECPTEPPLAGTVPTQSITRDESNSFAMSNHNTHSLGAMEFEVVEFDFDGE